MAEFEAVAPPAAAYFSFVLGGAVFAIGTGDPGREIEGPMAIVILGGLITSTALNLLVLPTLALRFGRFAGRDEWRSHPTAVPLK